MPKTTTNNAPGKTLNNAFFLKKGRSNKTKIINNMVYIIIAIELGNHDNINMIKASFE